MKRNMVAGGLFALLLAGCGLISSPPIDNPFQLAGKSVAVPLTASAQAVGTATATGTFDDLTSIPSGISSFTYTLAIQGVTFTGAGCPTTIPSPINVTLNANLVVSDGSGATARSSSASATGVTFTLTRTGTTIAVSNLSANTINFNLGTLLPIVQNGGTNTAALTANVTTVSTPDLAGCTMNLTWGGGQAVAKL